MRLEASRGWCEIRRIMQLLKVRLRKIRRLVCRIGIWILWHDCVSPIEILDLNKAHRYSDSIAMQSAMLASHGLV